MGIVTRGYFGIGIWHTKTTHNIGCLWRSAYLFGASFVFTVGARYDRKQAGDTPNVRQQIPLYHYGDMDDLVGHLPHSCPLVGVEIDPRAQQLPGYSHPARAAYLLGAEDHGLSVGVIDRCHSLVQIATARPQSMNVAVAGSILLHDRHVKTMQRQETPA